jgi:hypothetical protein
MKINGDGGTLRIVFRKIQDSLVTICLNEVT